MNECGGYIDDSDDGDQNSNDDDNDIDGRMDPKEKWKMRFGHKRLTLSELTNKLREETGDECKLCGCSYVTGQVTSVGKGGVLGNSEICKFYKYYVSQLSIGLIVLFQINIRIFNCLSSCII